MTDRTLIIDTSPPPEWLTADPVRITDSRMPTPGCSGEAVLVISTLEDGSHIWALAHDEVIRQCRLSPLTDWVIEERFTGSVIALCSGFDKLWKTVVNTVIEEKPKLKKAWEDRQ